MTQTNGEAPLKRILCLHGGGVNAEVFELQCRGIIARLKFKFRLVFMNAPFQSAPHPSIVSVFGEQGPFWRWLRWEPDHPAIDGQSAAEEIVTACRRAMEDDPGTGEWVGILGFSQGAKMAASVLWAQQKITEKLGAANALTNFKFGILMAGKAPLVMLDWRVDQPRFVTDAGELSGAFEDWPNKNEGEHVISIPTLHVHGLRDAGIEQHRVLRDCYCETGTAGLLEWDGGHRIPIKEHDIEAVSLKILELARSADTI